jgi:hypothetical protein
MNKKARSSSSSLFHLLAVGFLVASALISACAASPPPAEQVVVAPLGSSGDATASEMTREELEDHVRRFADRYITRLSLAANTVRDKTDDPALLVLAQKWKAVSYTTIVDIAIGQNAVTNLLDMMTLTRLSRLMFESYWMPEVFGPEYGASFLQSYVDLEDDIWTVADDVLTAQQQAELRTLIDDWHAENPEQIYPWYVKMSDFSGQRAASLAAVQQSGGMLQEVARAREAAEEIQAFGERVLFYLQRAPMITSAEFGVGASAVLGGPEISGAMDDMDRFVTAVERLVAVIDRLPDDRLAAVDQLMDRVSEERQALLRDVGSSEPNISNLLVELLPVLESLERTVVAAKIKNPDSRPFDVNEYTALVGESATTALELRRLVDSIDALLQDPTQVSPLVESLVEAEQAIVDRAFMQAIALIFIFFAALLGYRLIAGRLLSS